MKSEEGSAWNQDALRAFAIHTACWRGHILVGSSKLCRISTWPLSNDDSGVTCVSLCRGVKWNPLQERVDSVTSSPGQLVLSALLFTSAFLLLPTTTLFFLSLLLPCLAVALARHVLFLTSRYLSTLPLQYLLSFRSTPSASSPVTVPPSPASTTPPVSLADVAGHLGPLLTGKRYAFQCTS